jgi:hypothetical protein
MPAHNELPEDQALQQRPNARHPDLVPRALAALGQLNEVGAEVMAQTSRELRTSWRADGRLSDRR